MSDSSETEKTKFRFKATSFEHVNAPHAERPTAPVDVRAILEQNKAIAESVAKPRDLTKRPSRRRRDYILTVLGGNGIIIFTVAILPKNAVTIVFGFSGAIFFSIAVTWVIWKVMDDY